MDKDIVKELESKLKHKVILTYTPYGENQLRETSGILEKITDHTIVLKMYDEYGEESNYILNRHGCALHSMVDYGLLVSTKEKR